MKRSIFVVLVVSLCLVVALLFTSACKPKVEEPVGGDGVVKPPVVKPTPETVVLKMGSFLAETNSITESTLLHFVAEVNRRAAGELYIDYVGGPEVFAYGTQGPAIRGGLVDLFHTSAGHYRDVVPYAQAFKVTAYIDDPEAERAYGVFEYMDQKHRAAGLVYIGRHCFGSQRLFTVPKVNTPYEFKGMMFNAPTGYVKSLESIGIQATFFAFGEDYSALERGIVKGSVTTLSTAEAGVEGTILEILKYVYNHPFATCSVNTLANLRSWNNLPENLQKLILDVAHEAELKILADSQAAEARALKHMAAAGFEIVYFSDADAKWMTNKIEEAIWLIDVKAYVPAAEYPRLREVMGWPAA